MRLYLLLPLLVGPLALVCLRTLYLRAGSGWMIAWTFGIIIVTGEVVVGLQYLPLSPLSYGLILTGLAYALTNVAGAIEEGRTWPNLLIEPVFVMSFLWLLAFIVRV